MNLLKKHKQTHRLREQTFWLLQGEMGERDSQRVWDQYVHTALFKMDNQQGHTVKHREPLLKVMWQPGWDGILRENGYM